MGGYRDGEWQDDGTLRGGCWYVWVTYVARAYILQRMLLEGKHIPEQSKLWAACK